MIKFFRKIRQRLLSESKFSKYLLYAIGEIVLVVIGILIALQINNWNEQRKEGHEEQKVLKAIRADFLFNKIEIEQNIQETTWTVNGTKKVMDLCLLPLEEIDEQVADSALRHMVSFSTFHPSDGALQDLINAGKLNILKDDTLRDRLSNWNSRVDDVTEDEAYLKDFLDEYLLPIRLENLEFQKGSKNQVDHMHLYESVRFENIVKKVHDMASYQVRLYEELQNEIDGIITQVDEQIEPNVK
jgi:hypothetical protein